MTKEQLAAYQKRRSAEAVAAGYCAKCGKEALHTQTLCLTCALKLRSRVRVLRSSRSVCLPADPSPETP